MPTEFERSYVFTHDSANAFLKSIDQTVCVEIDEMKIIEDFYINRGLRVRKVCHSITPIEIWKYILTKKTGDKASGQREEEEEAISERAAQMLISNPILKVLKHRKFFKNNSWRKIQLPCDKYEMSIDFIYTPMRIAVLEVEAKNQEALPSDITQQLFNRDLIECPLDAVSYFNRRIGICGGPSSGKSSTAQHMSHTLNTVFQANSSHVAEFATTFIQKYRQTPDFWKEFFIWYGQRERERHADLANVVISDCPTFLTYVYLLLGSKQDFCFDTSLMFSKMYKRVLADVNWYSDLILLKLKEYKENGVRYQDKETALRIESRIQNFLDDHRIKYKTYDYTQADEILTNLFYINQ
jgi:nicotinamide riboside kinase